MLRKKFVVKVEVPTSYAVVETKRNPNPVSGLFIPSGTLGRGANATEGQFFMISSVESIKCFADLASLSLQTLHEWFKTYESTQFFPV